MNSEQALFEMHHVEISYNGEPIVHNVNLKVGQGEILGIVGESGSGKSTLIKSGMGLLGREGQVTNGEIYYKGKPLLKMHPEALRKLRGPEMGMIFQNCASALCPIRTIGDQLYEAVRAHQKGSQRETYEKAIALFRKMNLTEGERILKSYPFELSGGMNQRVGIVMAMLLSPKLLFADEPTSALDVIAQAMTVKELKKLKEEQGTTIVIVTHNIGLVSHIADKVAVMHKGQLVEYGDAKAVIHQPKASYTKQLIQAVPKLKRG